MSDQRPPSVSEPQSSVRTADDWTPLVYDSLRSLAGRALRRERASSTLQPTLLVHEAYLRMTTVARDHAFPDREHFLAAASRALRDVLVDHARRRDAAKRGGQWSRVTLSHPELDQVGFAKTTPGLDLLDLDEALSTLSEHDERAARVVECRVFGGMTVPETARVLGVSPRSVNLDWRFARAWLDNRLRPEINP